MAFPCTVVAWQSRKNSLAQVLVLGIVDSMYLKYSYTDGMCNIHNTEAELGFLTPCREIGCENGLLVLYKAISALLYISQISSILILVLLAYKTSLPKDVYMYILVSMGAGGDSAEGDPDGETVMAACMNSQPL